jgi:hypothetical protein
MVTCRLSASYRIGTHTGRSYRLEQTLHIDRSNAARPDPISLPYSVGQQAPQNIDLHRAKLHQLLPHPVQRQNGLLRFGLHGDFLARHLRDHPDCSRVRRIVLGFGNEHLDEFRAHQLHLIAHFDQPPGPMLGSSYARLTVDGPPAIAGLKGTMAVSASTPR